MKLEVIILVGIQGAGKSSFFRKFFPSHALISKDLMRRNKKNKNASQMRVLEKTLSEKKSVVIDNMNLSKSDRKALIESAHQFGATAAVYYFPMTKELSFERNSGPNRTEVPAVAIHTALKKFETPEWSEGFDEFFFVTFEDAHTFHLTEVPVVVHC